MRFKLDSQNLEGISSAQFLRRLGYALIQDKRSGSVSFVRRFGGGHYPRFHIYEKEGLSFDIHLDQKQVSYKGQTKHSGEYEGKIVEEEVRRILMGI